MQLLKIPQGQAAAAPTRTDRPQTPPKRPHPERRAPATRKDLGDLGVDTLPEVRLDTHDTLHSVARHSDRSTSSDQTVRPPSARRHDGRVQAKPPVVWSWVRPRAPQAGHRIGRYRGSREYRARSHE